MFTSGGVKVQLNLGPGGSLFTSALDSFFAFSRPTKRIPLVYYRTYKCGSIVNRVRAKEGSAVCADSKYRVEVVVRVWKSPEL